MKISVVVSVYNTPFNMLAPSLDSIVSQKCQCDYEVIIVDDGSQKEVHDFLEKICRENDHCRLITHEVNKGLSAARNTGMDNISGEYLFFPDSDDILFPGAIQRIFECLSEYPDVSFISFGYKHGIPRDADLLLDVRFLPNPFYIESLRKLTGNDKAVYDYVMSQSETQEFVRRTIEYYDYLLKKYEEEGKMQMIIGIGCTGGQHRSVTLTNYFAEYYSKYYQVYKWHRDADH